MTQQPVLEQRWEREERGKKERGKTLGAGAAINKGLIWETQGSCSLRDVTMMRKPQSVSGHLLHREEAGGVEARALRTVPSDVLLTGSLITCLEAGSGSTRMARCWLSCCRHSEGPFLQAPLTGIGSRGAVVPQPTCLPTSTLTVRLWEQRAGRPVSRDPAQH